MAKKINNKTDKKEQKKPTGVKSVLLIILVSVVLLSIGYAALATRLDILGDVKILRWIPSGKFDVHWDNVQTTAGSIAPVSPATISSDKYEVNYSVKFNTPGQFYEFTVDAVNEGDYDAKSSASTNSPLTPQQARYLSYTVLEEEAEPVEGRELPKNGRVTYRVRIEFKKDITVEDLTNASNDELDLSFIIPYVQK